MKTVICDLCGAQSPVNPCKGWYTPGQTGTRIDMILQGEKSGPHTGNAHMSFSFGIDMCPDCVKSTAADFVEKLPTS